MAMNGDQEYKNKGFLCSSADIIFEKILKITGSRDLKFFLETPYTTYFIL